MICYSMEFVLQAGESATCSVIKNCLMEWVQDLEILEEERNSDRQGRNFRVRMQVQDPTLIFDACAQFGRIKSVKIEEKGENG